jgi:hypothetical protein
MGSLYSTRPVSPKSTAWRTRDQQPPQAGWSQVNDVLRCWTSILRGRRDYIVACDQHHNSAAVVLALVCWVPSQKLDLQVGGYIHLYPENLNLAFLGSEWNLGCDLWTKTQLLEAIAFLTLERIWMESASGLSWLENIFKTLWAPQKEWTKLEHS